MVPLSVRLADQAHGAHIEPGGDADAVHVHGSLQTGREERVSAAAGSPTGKTEAGCLRRGEPSRLHDAAGEEQPQPRPRLLRRQALRQRVRARPLLKERVKASLGAEDADHAPGPAVAPLLLEQVLPEVEAADRLLEESGEGRW